MTSFNVYGFSAVDVLHCCRLFVPAAHFPNLHTESTLAVCFPCQKIISHELHGKHCNEKKNILQAKFVSFSALIVSFEVWTFDVKHQSKSKMCFIYLQIRKKRRE